MVEAELLPDTTWRGRRFILIDTVESEGCGNNCHIEQRKEAGR